MTGWNVLAKPCRSAIAETRWVIGDARRANASQPNSACRIGCALRAKSTGFSRPAILLVFDVLELAGDELAALPLSERRRVLERLLLPGHPCLQLVAHTPDIEVAEAGLEVAGLEGVIAKRIDRPYVAGRGRNWVKVKRHRTIDCAVVGIAGDLSSPRLVLGLRHADGRLHHLGRLGVSSVIFDVRARSITQPAARALEV